MTDTNSGSEYKVIQPTLRIFKNSSPPKKPAHLAHAIAAQTHRKTKAMARAKSRPHNQSAQKSQFLILYLYIEI